MAKILQQLFQSEPMVVFAHLPKTAGTSFRAILASYYSKKQTFSLRGQHLEEDIDSFKALSPRQRRAIKLLIGHTADRLIEQGRNTRVLTFLRHPVAHTLSNFRHIAQTPHNRHHETVKNLDNILDFLSWQQSSGFDNQQCRYLAGIDVRTDPTHRQINLQAGGEEYFEKAKAKLDSFDFVGITEYFDECLLLLQQQLHWPHPPYYIRLNESRNDKPTPPDSDTQTMISDVHRWDTLLYQYAEQLLTAARTRYQGDLQQDLDTFRMENSRYGQNL